MYGDIIVQLIREFQRYFPRNFQHPIGMLKITKRNNWNVCFSFVDCKCHFLLLLDSES